MEAVFRTDSCTLWGSLLSICTVDTLKGDAEIKLLVGCTADDIETVDKFYVGNAYMSGIVVIREARI